MISFSSMRVLDLSVTVASDLPAGWPTHMPFATKVWNYYVELKEKQGDVGSVGPYQTRFWIIDEHCGTHFDAPTHFVPPPDSNLPWAGPYGSETAEKVAIEDLMGPAAVVDVTFLCDSGRDGISPWITPEHLQAWEAKYGSFSPGEVVLLYTGWTKYYQAGPDGDVYCRNPVALGRGPGWPAPEPEAVLYLYDRGVRCVGIDAPSMGAAHDGAPAHQEGLSRGMRYIENLTNLSELPSRGAFFVFLPVKVAGATGAPGRAVALVER